MEKHTKVIHKVIDKEDRNLGTIFTKNEVEMYAGRLE